MLYTAYDEFKTRAKDVKYLSYRIPFDTLAEDYGNWITIEVGNVEYTSLDGLQPDGETSSMLVDLYEHFFEVAKYPNRHDDKNGFVFSMDGMLPKAGFCIARTNRTYFLYLVLDIEKLVSKADYRVASLERAYSKVELERGFA